MEEYEFEKSYWGDCCNTFDEDQKHYVYAKYMGLERVGYSFDLQGKTVIDIGGGPTSMLLKCINFPRGKVVDPIEYPKWTRDRYHMKNIGVDVSRGEDVTDSGWDECWIYNCLQHCDNPERVIWNALLAAKTLRIFEWVDIPPHDGHPMMLTEELMNLWIGLPGGRTVELAEQGCFGKAYYGVFTQ